MYNIGETKELYIFEQLIANLKKVTSAADAWVPLYIMTSEKMMSRPENSLGSMTFLDIIQIM